MHIETTPAWDILSAYAADIHNYERGRKKANLMAIARAKSLHSWLVGSTWPLSVCVCFLLPLQQIQFVLQALLPSFFCGALLFFFFWKIQ